MDELNETPTLPETPAEEPGMDASQAPAAPKKKGLKPGALAALVLGGMVLLAAAVFFGARLLNGQGLGQGTGFFSLGGGPNGAVTSFSIEMTPAPEAPQTASTLSGVVTKMEDNSLFLGTGNVSAVGSADGKMEMNYDGPVVEVVVNHATTVYRDATDFEDILAASEGGGGVQQVLEPGSVNDIPKNTMVSVWGDKQGDRIVAKTLIYH